MIKPSLVASQHIQGVRILNESGLDCFESVLALNIITSLHEFIILNVTLNFLLDTTAVMRCMLSYAVRASTPLV